MGNLAEYIVPVTLVVTLLVLLFQVAGGPFGLWAQHLTAKKTRLEIRKLEAELAAASRSARLSVPSVTVTQSAVNQPTSKTTGLSRDDGKPPPWWRESILWAVTFGYAAVFCYNAYFSDELGPKVIANLVMSMGCFTIFGVVIVFRGNLRFIAIDLEETRDNLNRVLKAVVFTAEALGQMHPAAPAKPSASSPVDGAPDTNGIPVCNTVGGGSGPQQETASEASGEVLGPGSPGPGGDPETKRGRER